MEIYNLIDDDTRAKLNVIILGYRKSYSFKNDYDIYEVGAVLNSINYELAYKYIIIELMIRTLERDRLHVEVFKTMGVMDTFFEQAIRKARGELLALKNEMGKIGLRKQGERKPDDTVTVYTFVQRGISVELRYMNYALRNHNRKHIVFLNGK